MPESPKSERNERRCRSCVNPALKILARWSAIVLLYPFVLFSPIAAGQEDEEEYVVVTLQGLSGDLQKVVVNAALPDPLRIRALIDDVPLAGASIIWTQYPGRLGLLTGGEDLSEPEAPVPERQTETLTDADGIASLVVVCGPSVGPRTIVVTNAAAYRSVRFLVACIDPAPNYSDLWWNPAEPGWALQLVHQGERIYAAWLTYGLEGQGIWLWSTANKSAPDSYAGTLQWALPESAPDDEAPAKTVFSAVGTFEVAFEDNDHGTFAYDVGGGPQTKPITRFAFDEPATRCSNGDIAGRSLDFQGLWHPGSVPDAASNPLPALNIVHQGKTMIANWLAYDGDGRSIWLMGVLGAKAPYFYKGPIYRLRGPEFTAPAFDPARVVVTTAGSMGISFQSRSMSTEEGAVPEIAYFAAEVEAAPAPRIVSKALVREILGDPEAICNM